MARFTKDDITWKAKVARALTHTELDNNFQALSQALQDISAIGEFASVGDIDTKINDAFVVVTELQQKVASLEATAIANSTYISGLNSVVAELQSKHPEIQTNPPVVLISPSQNTLSEANETSQNQVIFTINTQYTFQSETMGWSLSGTNITPEDFTDILVDGVSVGNSTFSGSFANPTITHTIKLIVARDELTEGGDEVVTLEVTHFRASAQTKASRSLTIKDTSLSSNIFALTYSLVESGPTLFEHLTDPTTASTASMWMENFDLSKLLITEAEKTTIKNTPLDYTGLIALGVTTQAIDSIVSQTVDEAAVIINGVITSFFGSNANVVLIKQGASYFGNYNPANLEFLASNNRKYVRNPTPSLTGIVYAETYNVPDLQAEALVVIDRELAPYASYPDYGTVRDATISFVNSIITIIVATVEAMSTTVDLYGYRELTPNS